MLMMYFIDDVLYQTYKTLYKKVKVGLSQSTIPELNSIATSVFGYRKNMQSMYQNNAVKKKC